jgi:hypothetical protein
MNCIDGHAGQDRAAESAEATSTVNPVSSLDVACSPRENAP